MLLKKIVTESSCTDVYIIRLSIGRPYIHRPAMFAVKVH